VSTGTSRSQNAHKIFVSVSSRKRWPLAAADPSPSPPPTPRPQGTLSHPPLSRRIYHLHAPLPCPRPALIHRQAPITPTNLDQQNRQQPSTIAATLTAYPLISCHHLQLAQTTSLQQTTSNATLLPLPPLSPLLHPPNNTRTRPHLPPLPLLQPPLHPCLHDT
jgi:hypothetical protein